MPLAVSTKTDTIDPFNVAFFQNDILKRKKSRSSQSSWEKDFFLPSEDGEIELKSDFSFRIKVPSDSVDNEKDVEINSSTEIEDYLTISTLTQEIEKFKNYREEIFDPDIPVGPNLRVINRTKDLIIDLVENNIPPFRITPSIEEGLCMAFNKDDILAYLEFYNDGDIGLIAENTETQKTVINVGLRNEEIIPTLLGLFNN